MYGRFSHILLNIITRFQDVYNIRLAYQAYEAYDMKGMVLDQSILLRTLKVSLIMFCFPIENIEAPIERLY